MAHRTSKNGSFRIDRRFKGIGRIALASGTKNQKRFAAFNAMLSELHEDGRLDLLRAIRDRRLSLQQVYEARRTGRLPYLASDMALTSNLWEAVEAWLPASAPSVTSRKRYEVSFRSFRRSGALSKSATVADLQSVDWAALSHSWNAGPADWNRLRSAVSRYLTTTLGDVFHPFRRAVMNAFPHMKEPSGRVPELPISLFWRIVSAAPEHVRPAYVTLAATGLRVGEYLALEEHHLRHLTYEIAVPGTKTAGSEAVIAVGEKAWQWVIAGVPSPLRYQWLRTHWKRACEACGARDLRLHDLRHLYGQSLVDAGRPEASVQQSLRHTDPAMTRRYTKRNDRRENALQMDEILFPSQPKKDRKGA